MANRSSIYRLSACIRAAFLAIACVGVAEMSAAQETVPVPRVRTTNAAVTNALELGARHSPTFRGLIARIEATDGIVFIEEGSCGHTVRACLLHFMTIAGPYRLLYIQVDPRKDAGCILVARLGHELYHAIEALSESNVRSSPAMVSLFQRIGPTGSDRHETRAAQRTGLEVEREVCPAL
jgi:hypothetical protein